MAWTGAFLGRSRGWLAHRNHLIRSSPWKTFSGIEWDRPIYAKPEPDGRHLIVIEQGGQKEKPSKLFRIVDDPEATEKQLLLSVPRRLVYGMTFHPRYAENGFIFLFSNGPTGEPGARESRHTVCCATQGRRRVVRSRVCG